MTADDSIHGFTVYNYTLKSDFFRDRFDDDTDTDLYLSVKNEGKRVDLGEMHISGRRHADLYAGKGMAQYRELTE